MKLQITVEGNAYEVEVEVLEEDEGASRSSYAPYHPFPATPHAQAHTRDDAADSKICLSPVNGLVIRVHVKPGQPVQPNDLVMVLEAMKMETNIMAPCAAIVKCVRVSPGDSVKLNQILVEFE